jgi:hypothetical protein
MALGTQYGQYDAVVVTSSFPRFSARSFSKVRERAWCRILYDRRGDLGNISS